MTKVNNLEQDSTLLCDPGLRVMDEKVGKNKKMSNYIMLRQ